MKVLLVSIAFPPKRDPESLQVAKYCKYLRTINNLNLEVITSADPTLFMEPDETLMGYRKGIKVVHEIKIFENRYLNFLIRKVNPHLLHYPDSKFSFWRQFKIVIKQVNSRPDILYSRSYPVSSTLLALKLKKAWGVPWVLHLSDPWAIATANSLSPATHFVGKARVWNKKKEEECFSLADRICLTSHKTIELYTNVYPQIQNKFFYAPNVYDDALMETNPFRMSNKLTFVYTGGFGQARTPYTFLEAISKFWKKHGHTVDQKVEFLFTGEMTRVNREIFHKYKDIPVINHLGIIPYSEVLALQKKADVLVNIDSNIKDGSHAVFFPSKLLEYKMAQRRILAITNTNSATHQFVQNQLGDCFEFGEVDKLADYFFYVFTKYQHREESFFYKPGEDLEFSAKHNAHRLADLFFSLNS